MSHLESRKVDVSEKYIDPSHFQDTLENAENLLKYAAEIGIEIEAHTRVAVLEARSTFNTGWNEHTAADLLSALAKLAARLKPITAESLKASRNGDSTATGRRYWVIAIVLAVLI